MDSPNRFRADDMAADFLDYTKKFAADTHQSVLSNIFLNLLDRSDARAAAERTEALEARTPQAPAAPTIGPSLAEGEKE